MSVLLVAEMSLLEIQRETPGARRFKHTADSEWSTSNFEAPHQLAVQIALILQETSPSDTNLL